MQCLFRIKYITNSLPFFALDYLNYNDNKLSNAARIILVTNGLPQETYSGSQIQRYQVTKGLDQ